MKALRGGLLLGLLLSSPGCADRNRVALLENRLALLEARVDGLEGKVEFLENERSFNDALRILEEMEDVAYLTPGAVGYSTIRTDLGSMVVSLEDIRPYANGTRITLRWGNLTSATVKGLKAKLEWGSVDENGVQTGESVKSRQVRFSQTLRSGVWTSVQVVLEGVPPTELGFVRVKDVTHTSISLLM